VRLVTDPKTLLAMADAQFSLGMSTLKMLRDALEEPVTPTASLAFPARCAGHEHCALSEDQHRQDHRATFGAPHAWQCVGCGYQGAM
jgi:hypothetical protein